MTATGVHLTVLIGREPRPASAAMLDALTAVEVTHSDKGRSAFQLTFRSDRGFPGDPTDYALLRGDRLQPWSRVILIVTMNARPRVIMDGFITDQQFGPGRRTGSGQIVVTGEDLGVAMDIEEKAVAHPAQNDFTVALKIIGRYAKYGIVPQVIPPPVRTAPPPSRRVPIQVGTDHAHLRRIAARYGFVFFLIAGPLPGASRAYWGPPPRVGVPQPALTVGMGADSNLVDIRFLYDGLAAQQTASSFLNPGDGRKLTVENNRGDRTVLVRRPALRSQSKVRRALLRNIGHLTAAEIRIRALAATDYAEDSVVKAEGELDCVAYGGLLEARRTVGVRGVGFTYDGIYYVSSVTHHIDVRRASYRQSFSLTREGTGALSPSVRP